MPFIPNTPESLLGRSDSKNPSSTCRGITSNGRPCRRSLATSPQVSSSLSRAKLAAYDPSDESLYCWQHKNQASRSARSSPGPRGTTTPIVEERTSLDTLADRLGLVNAETTSKKSKKGRPSQTHAGKQTLDTLAFGGTPSPRKSRTKDAKTLQLCFCFSVPIEEVQEKPKPVRPQPRPIQGAQAPTVPVPTPRPSPGKNNALSPPRPRPGAGSPAAVAPSPGKRSHKSRASASSLTSRYMSLIPDTVDPQTASALMAELGRPYVDSEEAGYIYMFWMTPTSSSAPPVDAARSLLAPPVSAPARDRRPSDVVSSFTGKTAVSGAKSKTMLLKIGRAANVQRRMNQWSRQCGYDVQVLRYYPYLPGSSEAAGVTPRMTPHCRRVERLVHIELAGMGLRAELDTCKACGKDHREWFEVQATRSSIAVVNEVIRKWVEWDENH